MYACMLSASTKPQIWLLEEATPEVAQLMHQLERSLGGQATVSRLSYTDALRALPREDARAGVAAVIVFTASAAQNLAALLKNAKGAVPRVCFFPPNTEAFAGLKCGARWTAGVSVVARHGGEAALFVSAGFKPERIVRLHADLALDALPECARPEGQPLRVGLAWHNMAPAQRSALETEISRWQQSAPERCDWYVFHLPGDEPEAEWLPEGVHRVALDAASMVCKPALVLDATLTDPWWPDAQPRPWTSSVRLFLPPGGGGSEVWHERWHERLQGLIDLAAADEWSDAGLLAFRYQPLWRHLLLQEERELPPLASPDLTGLEAARAHWHAWLEASRATWDQPEADEAPVCAGEEGAGEASPCELSHHFLVYDYRVQVSWCLDLWRALDGAKGGERHALLLAFNALALQYSSTSWLFKRLLARTTLGRQQRRTRRLGRPFWLRFLRHQAPLLVRWLRTLWACGRDEACDPLASSRDVARALLAFAGVTVVRENEPTPLPGVPTLYLLSHRQGELDPFLLLDVLPGQLAVVVGPRAQRWPLISRLGHSSAFVLTGRERGVVIADAIAAARSRRALALYPEVAEPTYLGEGSPLRSGLLWIVQAIERCQVIPVVLADAAELGPQGGTVRLIFGAPILCTPDSRHTLLPQVRRFFHRHLPLANALDVVPALERKVPEVPDALPALETEPAV